MENLNRFSTSELRTMAQLALVNMKAIKPEVHDDLMEKYTAIVIEMNRRNFNSHTLAGMAR